VLLQHPHCELGVPALLAVATYVIRVGSQYLCENSDDGLGLLSKLRHLAFELGSALQSLPQVLLLGQLLSLVDYSSESVVGKAVLYILC
jgi:hypothetical protein